MARTYTLKRRAESQAETRQRIVEAAVDLHTTVGPARATISMIAEKAGVQRHTFYAHFPDERSLLAACAAMHLEREPLPDATLWAEIADGPARLRTGLGEVYAWFERNADLVANVLRDAQHHAVTHETSARTFGPYFANCHAVLGAGLSPRQSAFLTLALSFYTWETLTRQAGFGNEGAAKAMAEAIGCVTGS